MSDLDRRNYGSFNEIYAAARERVDEGAIVCLLPVLLEGDQRLQRDADEDDRALFTGYRLDTPTAMPACATHDSERVRAQFIVAYMVHTRQVYGNRVRFASW